MLAGFAKQDITPRAGVELSGFGPFITRHSIAVRDRLWARAMAMQAGGQTLVLVSCDLIGVEAGLTRRVRDAVTRATGLPPRNLMLHCTHTHSGPATGGYIGWGAPDAPYLEILPGRVASACVAAMQNLAPATLSHCEVPCEGIGVNRQYDRGPALEEAMREDWRPARPELTDTTCQVLRVDVCGRVAGLVSYFGCHPVVCCADSRHIHGDYCGVASGLLEREHPGAVALFLQGAQGDVNSCVVHRNEQESLLALDVIASRYARAVRNGLALARPVRVESLAAASRGVAFSRKPWTRDEVLRRLAEQEGILSAFGATDQDKALRMAVVRSTGLRRVLGRMDAGEPLAPEVEVQGFRVGSLLFLASPFETFQAIKNDVRAATGDAGAMVMGLTNDVQGYAPDRTTAAAGGYAADTVPHILGALPYAAIHDELVQALTSLARDLGGA